MRIAILVPEFNWPGDAVGNDVHGMYQALVKAGIECTVFTAVPHRHVHIKSGTFSDVGGWLSAKDLLIYHYAGGGEAALQIAKSIACPIILRYHNVTPSHFFDDISAEYAQFCTDGRRLLSDFVHLPNVTGCSVSAYNAQELLAAGLPKRRSFVVPPFHMIDELARLAAPAPERPGRGRELNVLYVGRWSPNKRIDLLFEIFADLRSRIATPVRLFVVGSRDLRLQTYLDRVDAIVTRRDLARSIEFRHGLSPEEVARCYRGADAFMTCSEHEGFCVPVVEAMALGIPVIAHNSCALPETCGGSALLCSSKAEFVLNLQQVLFDKPLRDRLSAAGRQRYTQHFTEQKISLRFLRMLNKIRYPVFGDLVSILSPLRRPTLS